MNEDFAADVRDLDGVFTGSMETSRGDKIPVFRKYAWGRIAEEKYEIDLYVWIQAEPGETHVHLRCVDGGRFNTEIRRLLRAE